jgi:hypothetical protein
MKDESGENREGHPADAPLQFHPSSFLIHP